MPRKKEPTHVTEKYTFPTRLRKLMEIYGTTQKKLADAIDMRPQTVSLYTTGQSFPDVNTLKKIADFFNASADYLLGISDTASPPDGETVGDRIRQRRQQLGINMESLAEKLDVPLYVVQRYEKNELPKSWESMIEIIPPIAAALQCSPEYLVGWENSMHVMQGKRGIDAYMPAFDIAERTGFDVKILAKTFDYFRDYEHTYMQFKMFDLAAYHVFLDRAREFQTEKNISKIREALNSLDVTGQKEAVKRVEELTEIPKYRRMEPKGGQENAIHQENDHQGG